ncbi:MAG: nuclear transport factor 2 family protein [Gammaproteobacteria bacterium]
MRRLHGAAWLGAGLLLCALMPGDAPASIAEDEAIKAVVLDYAEAWATGDAERMARALHPEAVRRRVVSDVLSGEQRLLDMDAMALIQATRAGVGKPLEPGPLNLRIAILDRHGDMATARVVSPLYVDYLQLVRWEDRWVVLMVLWGTIAGPGA